MVACCDFSPVSFFNQETAQSTNFSKQDIEEWEIDRSEIQLVRKMKAGQFGEVWEGLWNNTTSVAVKTLKPGTMSTSDFLQEATMLMKLRHPRVIQLHAVCTKEEPVYIVTELKKHGNLLEYLRQGKRHSLKLPQLIDIASQVASGMSYLQEQNIIHLDLAARNVLVGDHMICKVSDFKLAKVLKDDIYEAPEGFKFPIRWTTPEALLHNHFTIKSDVWSFGIVLWETINYGRTPYSDMTNQEVLQNVHTGYRMPRPPNCPEQVHDIIIDCWREDPTLRPSFDILQWQLEDAEFSSDDSESWGSSDA